MTVYNYVPHVGYKVNLSSGGIDMSEHKIYVNETQYFEPKFPNIFEEYEITKNDSWSMSNNLFLKMLRGGTLELNEYFNLYRAQLNFAIFCATSALGISKEHLTQGSNLLKSFYNFHLYYHVRRILHILQAAIPNENTFDKFKNSYSKSAYHKVCNEYGVDPSTLWLDGAWYYDSIGVFHDGGKKSINKYTKINQDPSIWILEKSKGFTTQGLFMISESVRVYAYLILSSQASAKSSIIGRNASVLTAQKIFINNFENVINRRVNIQEDINRFQNVLNYASSKVDFSVGLGIFMFPSDMNLKIKTNISGYNNEILISKKHFALGVNSKVNNFAMDYKHKEAKSVHLGKLTKVKNRNEITSKSSNITHEEEKVALILLLSVGFTMWWIFK